MMSSEVLLSPLGRHGSACRFRFVRAERDGFPWTDAGPLVVGRPDGIIGRMATLLPAYETCNSRIAEGVHDLARKLEHTLDGDYLIWYRETPPPSESPPLGFVLLHPRRGLLFLEIAESAVQDAAGIDRALRRAREAAQAATETLRRDPQLTFSSGRLQGQLVFPLSYGVVLPTGALEAQGLAHEQHPAARHLLDLAQYTGPAAREQLAERLWDLCTPKFQASLASALLDRVRWHLFPEVRIPLLPAALGVPQLGPAPAADLTSELKVFDLQQERILRSIGPGQHVIHGVAGAGKTLMLAQCAARLAERAAKPVLVLCHNRSLLGRLRHLLAQCDAGGMVQVFTFHQWCREQLYEHECDVPSNMGDADAWFDSMIDALMRDVSRERVPGGQYAAVLVDEAHDFHPDWLRLIGRMPEPECGTLLLLFDDSLSIYPRERRSDFSFAALGIDAQGRTHELVLNHRNPRPVFDLAVRFARPLLEPEATDADGIPRLAPVSAVVQGAPPQILRSPAVRERARDIAEMFMLRHRAGMAWRDMAVIYRRYNPVGSEIMSALHAFALPATFYKDAWFENDEDTVKVISMHSCMGLEYPLVVLADADESAAAQNWQEARLLYAATTRAMQELVVFAV